MRYGIRGLVGALTIGCGLAVGVPHVDAAPTPTITIDARALTSPQFDLTSVSTPLSTSSVQTISAAAGTYTFRDARGNAFVFTVDSAGVIGYASGLESFLDGAGTSSLVVDGFDVTVDARSLTSPTFDIPNITTSLGTGSVQGFTGIPGSLYAFRDARGNFFSFTIDGSGDFDHASGLASFVGGAGTPALVVDGFDVTVDARSLTSPTFDIPNITTSLGTGSVQGFTGIPGSLYAFRDARGNNFAFTIAGSGDFAYASGYEDFLDGSGTTALVVDGFDLTIDAREQSQSTFYIANITSYLSSSTLQSVTLIPGSLYVFQNDLGGFGFHVDADGLLQNLPTTYQGLDVSGTGTSLLTIGFPNLAPTADAGPDQAIHASDTVYLDGSGSFDDQTDTGDLEYAWSFVSKPASSSATLSGADTDSPSFTADVTGTFVVRLVVTDEDDVDSDADTVQVSSANLAPTADAGLDDVVDVDDALALDGSGSSDPDGDSIAYSWSIVSAPSGSTASLVDANTATPELTPDVEGAYEISLVVSDSLASSAADTVIITAIGTDYAQDKLQAACVYVSGLADASFDAKGHRKAMCNEYASIIRFVQKGQTAQALAALEGAIARVDGVALRDEPDPKGASQSYAADYIVDEDEQVDVHDLLTAAWDALD